MIAKQKSKLKPATKNKEIMAAFLSTEEIQVNKNDWHRVPRGRAVSCNNRRWREIEDAL
jgi:hypothetical protein